MSTASSTTPPHSVMPLTPAQPPVPMSPKPMPTPKMSKNDVQDCRHCTTPHNILAPVLPSTPTAPVLQGDTSLIYLSVSPHVPCTRKTNWTNVVTTLCQPGTMESALDDETTSTKHIMSTKKWNHAYLLPARGAQNLFQWQSTDAQRLGPRMWHACTFKMWVWLYAHGHQAHVAFVLLQTCGLALLIYVVTHTAYIFFFFFFCILLNIASYQ